jgi:16S rRNA (guanine527-N7)-methyltransferase
LSRDPNETWRKPEKPAAPTAPAHDTVFDFAVAVSKYQKWFPDLTPDVLDKLATYSQELLRFNKTVNLISATTIKNAEAVHFADSVAAARLVLPHLVDNAPLHDFGSGNGLPGLVFGLMFPKLKVVLVDRDQRKLEFCKHIASTLKLTNVSIQTIAVEDLEDASVLNAIGRGFAPLSRALLTARRPVGKGGRFFHMKGDGWANELAQVPSQLFSFWSPSLLGQYRIPETTTEMAVVMTSKVAD